MTYVITIPQTRLQWLYSVRRIWQLHVSRSLTSPLSVGLLAIITVITSDHCVRDGHGWPGFTCNRKWVVAVTSHATSPLQRSPPCYAIHGVLHMGPKHDHSRITLLVIQQEIGVQRIAVYDNHII